MSDLVERLRATNKKVRHSQELRDEAADKIERLQRQLADVASYESSAQRKEIERLVDRVDLLEGVVKACHLAFVKIPNLVLGRQTHE